jgi:hypothetical protein
MLVNDSTGRLSICFMSFCTCTCFPLLLNRSTVFRSPLFFLSLLFTLKQRSKQAIIHGYLLRFILFFIRSEIQHSKRCYIHHFCIWYPRTHHNDNSKNITIIIAPDVHSGRPVSDMKRRRPLKQWDRGFESHSRQGCLCLCCLAYG